MLEHAFPWSVRGLMDNRLFVSLSYTIALNRDESRCQIADYIRFSAVQPHTGFDIDLTLLMLKFISLHDHIY